MFIGYLPPVNAMREIGMRPVEQPSYPAEVLRCAQCTLVQLGAIVDPLILFPPTYPYTSGTTRLLRENFAELAREVATLYPLGGDDLVVDIGSNDGTLLSNFIDHRVLGIEPTQAARLAVARGILTDERFFDVAAARDAVARHGRARLVTATNVFAHMEDIHTVIEALLELLAEDGIFVSESHSWLSLVETVQYDTIYHEHLRYYTVGSLASLLGAHGLEILHAKRIPTHGGSIRVYAARQGQRRRHASVDEMLALERAELTPGSLHRFRNRVVASKLGLLAMLDRIRGDGAAIYGIGAPSRASTLIAYTGLDEGILDAVVEVSGSHKIGKYVPGTLIPVIEERSLFDEQPGYALLLSWHIADELCAKLRERGFRGRYIVPLPEPRVLDGGISPGSPS